MLLAPAVCGAQDLSSPRGKVTAVRFWSLGEVTRIAVEVSTEFTFKYNRLTDPERLAFDIFGSTPAMVTHGVHTIPVGDALLDQIRVAEKEPGVTRIVLDLPRQAEVTPSQLANPSRLVIELHAKEKPPSSGTPSVTKVKELIPPVPPTSAAVQPPPVTQAMNRAPEPIESEPQYRRPPARPFVPPVTARTPPVKLVAISLPPFKIETRKLSVAGSAVLPVLDAPVASKTPPAPAVVASNPTVVVNNPAVGPSSATAGANHPAAVVQGATRASAPGTRPAENLEPQVAKRSAISGDRSLTRALGLKLGRVVLDPGHGGYDQGTHGPSGYLEKDLALDIALRLGELIHEQLGSEVVYTRSEDTFVALEERTHIANERRADLFLSIHANSSPYRAAAGSETFVLNFTTSKTAMDLASRENASSQRSIFDLQELVQQIALKDKVDESREFAVRLQTALAALSGRVNERAKDRGVKKAPFVVLIGASMPSVLAEIGFLSNTTDEKLLRTPEHRQKIAEALSKGIAAYAGTLSRFQVAGKPAAAETVASFSRRP